MIIKEIELNNFRIYQGYNKIELQTEKGKNIIVISGKNGFGKTTFLMSLVWCLYGKSMQEVDELYRKEIADQGGYPKYIANSLNRFAKTEGDTKFYVSVTFSDIQIPEVPCREIKITRTYNTETGANESIEILIDGHVNELTKEVGEEIFIRDFILPKEIAKFFFFDAEKIVSLAEVNSPDQRRKLSEAYTEVLGIKKFEDLKRELEELQIRLRQASATPKEKAQFNQLEADIKNATENIESNDDQIKELKEKQDGLRFDSNKLQEKLIRAGSSITVEELTVLKKDEEALSKKLADLQEELKDSYDIIPFAIAGERFMEVSKQLENETNHKIALFKNENVEGVTDNILTDLSEELKNFKGVVDFKIQDYYNGSVRKLIKKHFFSDIPELPKDFKVIHEFSDTMKNDLSSLLSNLKYSFRESFKRITSDFNQTRNDLNAIRRKLKDAEAKQEDPIIAADRERKETIDTEIRSIDEKIIELRVAVETLKSSRGQAEKQRNELAKKLEVSSTNKKKDDVTARLVTELKAFISNFKEEKKKSLENQILKGLKTLMHKKGFIKRVEVEIINEDIDIHLYNSRNEIIRKEGLSKGEQQMYATALLKGLVEESDIDFPVFIDSPMQKFDEEHAENIVKHFYPSVSDQVVLFPLINKEMSAKEYDLLFPKVVRSFLIQNVTPDKSEFLSVEPKNLIKTYNKIYNNAN
jgi:DNA sulfur modification protein DndD